MIYYSDDGLTVRAMTEADAEALAAGEIAQGWAIRWRSTGCACGTRRRGGASPWRQNITGRRRGISAFISSRSTVPLPERAGRSW